MTRRLVLLLATILVVAGCSSAHRVGSAKVWVADSERPCAAGGRPTIPGARGCRSEGELTITDLSASSVPSVPVQPTSIPPDPSEAPPPPWTGTPAEKRFAWAETSPVMEAATVTLVHGMSPRAALRLVVTDALTPVESAERADAYARNHLGDAQLVSAGRLRGGWTIVIEDNGFNATIDPTAAQLSRNGTAVVIYQNVEALTSFEYAVGGRLVRGFDPLIYDAGTGRRLPQERGIRFGDEADLNPMAQSFLLAFRLTGIALTERDLETTAGRIGVAVRL